MHFKLGLISGLITVASATHPSHIRPDDFNRETFFGKHYVTQYVHPNAQETCFSVRPVATCDDKHVSTDYKYQKVGFHCLDSNSHLTREMKREVQYSKKLSLEKKTQDIQAYVEVPTHCEPINENDMRKQYERNYNKEKVHVIQKGDTEDSFCDNSKIYNYGNKSNQNRQEEYERILNSFVENLTTNYVSVRDILTMNQLNFEKYMNILKLYAYQVNNEDSGSKQAWKYRMNHVLPNVYSKVAKQFYNTVIYDEEGSQFQNEEFYGQYTDIVKRLYSYFVKQILQNMNNPYSNQYQKQLNMTLRSLWNKVQLELTIEEIEQLNKIIKNFEIQKSKLDENSVNEVTNIDQLKKIEHQLTKVLVSGLFLARKHYEGHNEVQENLSQYSGVMKLLKEKLHDYENWETKHKDVL